MPPSEAEKHGYERANKHPKSTKFGRQNPTSERWNSEEQLIEWRKAWADATNRYLERYGHDGRIDHRSHADRGLTEHPTIHEGVVARALEKLRSSMLIFSYQLRHIGVGKHNMGKRVKAVKPELERYAGLVQQIKDKSKERKKLLAEKKETPFFQIPKLHDFTHRITALTEEIEELKSKQESLLCPDDAGISAVKKDIAAMENSLKRLEEQEIRYTAELDSALKEYEKLKEQAAGMDADELMDARLAVRETKECSAIDRVKAAYGEKFDSLMMFDSKRDVANLLCEEAETRSIREHLRQKQQQQTQQRQNKKKSRDSLER